MNSHFRNNLLAQVRRITRRNRGDAGAAREGFTLLEVLIAMIILVFISFAIYESTTRIYRRREELLVEGDFYNAIRLSMNLLQRDVSLLYSPLLIAPPKPNPAPPADARDLEMIMNSDLGQSTQYWGGATDKTAIRPSRFQGTDSKMSFIAVSHIRMYKNAPESEFNKVSFELKTDPKGPVPDTSALIKTSTPNAFEAEERRDQLGSTYPLLHGIKKFKLRYYRKDKDQWNSSWDSEKEDFKNLYPDIIEIQMEVTGPFRLRFDGIFRFRPEFPLYGLDPST